MLINFDFGLSQLSGNEALLIKLLGKIKAEYADCESKLNDLFDQQDWESAKIITHTLKGVAGNLGCQALHEAAKNADNELKLADSIPASVNELYEALNKTVALIAQIEQNNSLEPVLSNSDTASTDETARRDLIDLLNDNAFVSPDVLHRAISSLNLSKEDKKTLEQAINTLDYATALALLKS